MSPADDHPISTAALRGTPKQDRIEATLRGEIRDGTLAPGSRLATRKELQLRFAVASLTMQAAIDRLTADGFLVARGQHGTFVVDHPPSASNYGLVFPFPETRQGVQLWRALISEAAAIGAGGRRHLTLYHGIDGHADNPDHQRLVRDLHHERLAGLVFAVNPFAVVGTPVLDEGPAPRIAIMDQPLIRPNGRVGCVVLDEPSFVAKALDQFVEHGRRRVAVISVPGMEGHCRRLVLDGMAARGLATRPYWWHVVEQTTASSARAIAHLLFHRGQPERPDALLITDDNLVEHAVAGLLLSLIHI